MIREAKKLTSNAEGMRRSRKRKSEQNKENGATEAREDGCCSEEELIFTDL